MLEWLSTGNSINTVMERRQIMSPLGFEAVLATRPLDGADPDAPTGAAESPSALSSLFYLSCFLLLFSCTITSLLIIMRIVES